MPQFQELPTAALVHIAQQLQISMQSLVATIALFDEGGTVPFIARYRKEATGNLDEVQIRSIEEKLLYHRELEDRRATVLKSIEEQGKLTPELKTQIERCFDRTELEDLYLPYKPKRRTKASIAREKGLEPLAQRLWDQTESFDPAEAAADFINAELGVNTAAEALEGARHIVSEWISENAEFRKALRAMLLEHGTVVSKAIEGVEDPEGKYRLYTDHREPAKSIPSHRMLAIRRGAKEGILFFEIEMDRLQAVGYLRQHVVKSEGAVAGQLLMAIEDGYDRLLYPSMQTEVRLELKDRSDEEAIRVFAENLESLLLAAPAGALRTLAIDPGLRTGCKVAVVDETGKYLENSVIYPHEPKNDVVGSINVLGTLIRKYEVRAIAIGNGTASRETDSFVRDFLRQAKLDHVFGVVVSESGASVYSASDIAREEFPQLDLTVRGAISIARRLQDPLAELVKVDPKSIGVGQYQHDVDQRRLQQGLDSTVESCVNRVGVDLNTASWALLRYVAGINERTAKKIVEYRDTHGAFKTRQQLMDVPGFGPKTFEQAAGFLRIRGGDQPLDKTSVHPESYPVVQRIAETLNVGITELIQQPALMDKVKAEQFADAGIYTIKDIFEELKKPGRDPRDQFVAPQFRDDVKELKDLQVGMVLEGTVTNVANFGAFVDVGVHQDGLVHVSQLSARFIKDPREAVKVGQIVKVKVLEVDLKAKRIALSIKALQEGSNGGGPRPGGAPNGPRPGGKPQGAPPPKQKSVEDQLASLNNRFRTR